MHRREVWRALGIKCVTVPVPCDFGLAAPPWAESLHVTLSREWVRPGGHLPTGGAGPGLLTAL